jgi:hypothetical protein
MGPSKREPASSRTQWECGFRTGKTISRQSVAKLHLLMQVIHNNYQAGSGRNPPPTVLNPLISQRFSLNNGHIEFLDDEGSAFLGHAAGRFFPAIVAGVRQLRITGVVDFTQGLANWVAPSAMLLSTAI